MWVLCSGPISASLKGLNCPNVTRGTMETLSSCISLLSAKFSCFLFLPSPLVTHFQTHCITLFIEALALKIIDRSLYVKSRQILRKLLSSPNEGLLKPSHTRTTLPCHNRWSSSEYPSYKCRQLPRLLCEENATSRVPDRIIYA